LQLPSASGYNHSRIMDDVGSPTEDLHLISSRPCWAYTKKSTATTNKRGVFDNSVFY